MKLKHPSENRKNIWNELDTKSDDFEYFVILNNLFEQFEIKIINIIDQIIYQIMNINQKPKDNRLNLKRR